MESNVMNPFADMENITIGSSIKHSLTDDELKKGKKRMKMSNETEPLLRNVTEPLLRNVDIEKIEQDFDCICFGTTLLNASPRIVLTFIMSTMVIFSSFAFMYIKGHVEIFAPIVSGIIGFWLPSPVQSITSKKDSILSARLLQCKV